MGAYSFHQPHGCVSVYPELVGASPAYRSVKSQIAADSGDLRPALEILGCQIAGDLVECDGPLDACQEGIAAHLIDVERSPNLTGAQIATDP
jgi:hypothetical protein